MTLSALEEHIQEKQALGESICDALKGEIDKLELPESPPPPNWEQARFKLRRDPALGTESLEALWLDDGGRKLGEASLHEDGSFYAEYDVIRPHPRRAKWFIEAVIAWGRKGVLKTEPRLLPLPE